MVFDLKIALIIARVSVPASNNSPTLVQICVDITYNLFSPISSAKLTLLWGRPYEGASCKMDEDPSKFTPTFLRKMSWEVLPHFPMRRHPIKLHNE
jgi:hypothetical protein